VAPRFAPMIGLIAGLAPVMAAAQTNLDQGKSPGQIFAADCAVCHKSARGLANGKNASTLASFLREHYTTSREQAAALAAYVLKAPAEEPKPSSQQARQSGKPEKQEKPEKPEEGTPATAKLQRPAEETKLDDIMVPEQEPRPPASVPGAHAPPGRNDHEAATAAHGRRKEREAIPAQAIAHEPPAIAAEPAPAETATPEMAPTAAAPAATEPGENAPVPRDDIPD